MSDAEIHARCKKNNIWLGLVLVCFVALVFAITVAKMMGGGTWQGYDHVYQPELDNTLEQTQ